MGKYPPRGEGGSLWKIHPEDDVSDTDGFPVNSNLCLQWRGHLIRASLLSFQAIRVRAVG